MKCSPKTMLKIGAALAILLGGGWFLLPQLRPTIARLAPFALFALCPLSMLFMMGSMNKGKGQSGHDDGCASCGHDQPPRPQLPPSSDRISNQPKQ